MARPSSIALTLSLVASCAACGPTKGRVASSPTGAEVQPPVVAPKKVDRTNFADQRAIYEALDRPDPAFRRVLLDHLLERAGRSLDRDRGRDAFATFNKALTLFAPEAVFAGKARAPRLAALAERLERYFTPWGDESVVLPALAVRISLQPRDATLPRRFWRIAEWVGNTSALVWRSPYARGVSVRRHVRLSAHRWPSAFILDALHRLLLERAFALVQASPHRRTTASARMFAANFARRPNHAQQMARLFVWVDRPKVALGRLKQVRLDAKTATIARSIERTLEPGAGAAAHLDLAGRFIADDRRLALTLCRRTARRFPQSAEAHDCVGRLATLEKHPYLALVAVERAYHLKPKSFSLATALAERYYDRLLHVVRLNRLQEARQRLVRFEAFYRRVAADLGRRLPRELVGGARSAIGQGLYDAGRVEEAETILRQATTESRAPEIVVLLATIALKRGDAARALRLLGTARGVNARPQALAWQRRGKIEGLRGLALGALGKGAASLAAHKKAIVAWALFLGTPAAKDPVTRVEARLSRARSLYAVARKAHALDELERAVDDKPSRKETYATVIALLATNGHLPEALDAYHRALGRREMTRDLKTYCTFWVIGLARRARVAPDARALAHLRSLKGDLWYAKLARLVLGNATFAELEPRAKTPAERAELYFYEGERLLAAGQADQARAMWRRVLGTKMMAFFEYDMAAHNLRHGVTQVASVPVDRRRKSSPGPAGPRSSEHQ